MNRSGMDDVEHLRAKAIASMPSSSNPSSSADVNASAAAISVSDGGGRSKSKSHKSREEGEVSSSSDVDLGISSVSLPNNTIQHVPIASRDRPLQKIEPAVKVPTTVRLSTSDMHFGSSVLPSNRKSYPKHFKRKQIPLRSAHNQARHWHAKSSRNNLVISFSDDDSGSDSKEHIPEKDAKQISDLKHEPIPFAKKGFANRTIFSSIHRANVPTSGFQGPSAENASLLQSQSPVVKEITNQELGQVQRSSIADQSLVVLRGQMAARDDRLKEQNKLALQNGATIISASNKHGTCAMKPENHEDLGRNADETISRFGVDEPSKKRLKLEKSSSAPDFDMSSKLENWKKCHADNSCSYHESVPANLKESVVLKNKSPFEVHSIAALHGISLSEKDYVVKKRSFERLSKRDKTSDQPSDNVDSMHLMLSNQLMTSKSEVGMSAETLYVKESEVGMSAETLYVKEKSPECGSGNNEVNILESECVQLQSLVKLEELHDKELEEAQQHRRMCELEERRSLKAYRKAQRALVAANERCNLLYQKRERFSTKFSAFLLKASNSVWPSNWLRQESPQEDQLCDPNASASVQQDYSALAGAVPHVHNLNMSTDDDEENFPSSSRFIESKSADVNLDNGKEPSLDNSPDYELLEASLRSKLVARMGIRASPKVNDTRKGDIVMGKRVGGIAADKNPLLIKNMPSSEKKQTCSKGIHRPKDSKGSSCLLSAPPEFQSHVKVFSSNGKLQVTSNVKNNDPNNSFFPITAAVFPLPYSDLHILCRHLILFFPDCKTKTSNMSENNNILTSKEMANSDCIPDITAQLLSSKNPAITGYKDLFGRCHSSVEFDPFWPLCMFEFRGKCNDEECPWQHIKSGSRFSCLQHLNSENAPTNSFNVHHALSIPTYQVGPYLIKAEPYLSQSVLAGSNWQYHLWDFCASFSLPLSVRRVLPPNALYLNPVVDSVADCSWNRLSLYCQSQDGKISCEERIKQGSGDVEQLLEVALNQFDGKFCKQERKKVLSLLARAIEAYPSSVVLWVVYLYFYYIKEKVIGKDDMFLHAVQHNKGSYELWLLYINSRMLCEDRANAYDQALKVLCRIGIHDGTKHSSPFILDIFLQMINFLCMSGQIDKAISIICKLLATEFGEFDDLLPDIHSGLTVTDTCLFWINSVYFVVYEKLPETTVKQFEFVKDLTFELNWPPAQVNSNRKDLILKFMNLAMSQMASLPAENPQEIDKSSLRELCFLAVSHVKCVAALEGSLASMDLLNKYLKFYPWCIELVLMAIRTPETWTLGSEIPAFEAVLSNWPKGTPGIQCIWNQYAEFALANRRIELFEKLTAEWCEDPKFSNLSIYCSSVAENSVDSSSNLYSAAWEKSTTKDDSFGFLNLCLHLLLQKNAATALIAMNKSLELSAPEDYEHFVKEHAAFTISSAPESRKQFPVKSLYNLLNRYLVDPRARIELEPLSRSFIKTIKKPRIQQMVNNLLGAVSKDSSLVNSVLEACYGPSLLPEDLRDLKAAVDLVETLMEMMPTNYELALSVYRTFSRNVTWAEPSFNSVKFWACSLLINSMFQAVPVPPEHIWLETAAILSSSDSSEISLRFHKQAVSVYPFSVKLWQFYARISDDTKIVEAAQERGIDLSNVL